MSAAKVSTIRRKIHRGKFSGIGPTNNALNGEVNLTYRGASTWTLFLNDPRLMNVLDFRVGRDGQISLVQYGADAVKVCRIPLGEDGLPDDPLNLDLYEVWPTVKKDVGKVVLEKCKEKGCDLESISLEF